MAASKQTAAVATSQAGRDCRHSFNTWDPALHPLPSTPSSPSGVPYPKYDLSILMLSG